MKTVLEDVWSTIKKLQEPSRTPKNKDVWTEKYRQQFTCVIPSSKLTQLGAKRNALNHNSPQMGEKESRKTPAAFITKDLSSPYHYHGHEQTSPPRTLTVFAMSIPTWVDGAPWSPGHCALSWSQRRHCSQTKLELPYPALHLVPPHTLLN